MKNAGAKVLLLPMARNINYVKDFRALFKITSLIKKKKYDIVHAHSSKAGGLFRLAAWIYKVPLIYYTPHCFYFQGKKRFKKFIFLLLEKLLAIITTCIIVSENEHEMAKKNKVTNCSKLININNAIDFDEYQQSKDMAETKVLLSIRKNAFIVGAIGRLALQKDWETYIYAANEVLKTFPETVFLIVGEGELHNDIQKLIFKLNLKDKVLLTGHVQEIYKIYGILDIFINTSLWEGLPYVFLEAMKYKKPIIATNTGNSTTIIHNKTGFLDRIKDYRSIAEKIITLIENKQLTIQMGERGYEWLTQKYSFELFIRKHTELYSHRSKLEQKHIFKSQNDFKIDEN